jgi:hypothetical protein
MSTQNSPVHRPAGDGKSIQMGTYEVGPGEKQGKLVHTNGERGGMPWR